MLKNNIIAIVAYLILIPIFYGLYVMNRIYFGKYDLVVQLISILLWGAYLWVGAMLTPQTSKLKNLFSTVSVSVIGLILLIFEINSFGIYNFPQMTILLKGAEDTGNFGSIIFLCIFVGSVFIPTLLMWVGLELKAGKQRAKGSA